MYNPMTNDYTHKAINLYTSEITRAIHAMSCRNNLEIGLAMDTIKTYKRGILDSLTTDERAEVMRWIDRYNLTIEHVRFSLDYDDSLESLGNRIDRLHDKIRGGR